MKGKKFRLDNLLLAHSLKDLQPGLYVDLRVHILFSDKVHGRPDPLRLQHKFTQEELQQLILKTIIVVPDGQLDSSTDLRDSDEIPRDIDSVPASNPLTRTSAVIDPDMTKLAFAFGKYFVGLPAVKAYASAGSRGTGNSETLQKIERSCLEVSLPLVV